MNEEFAKMKEDLRGIICDVIKNKANQESLLARLCDSTPYQTAPGRINDITGSCRGETTYQRCFLNSKGVFTLLPQKYEVKFLDGELPVVFGESSRRNSIDLVGTIDKNPFICELKYVNPDKSSKSNSPKFALLEIAAYYYQILQNQKSILQYKIKHANKELPLSFWKDICDSANLLVLGNKKYWARWEHGAGVIDMQFLTRIRDCFYDKSVKIYLCEAAEYKPEMVNGNRYYGVLEHQNIFVKSFK